MRYRDWGERSPRWQGIRSETIDVCGTSVHYLRADAHESVPEAPVQLLVHPMAAAGTLWLDAIRPLTAHGPVIAPDLPGTVLGETPAPTVKAARIAPSARFLRAFVSALGLDRVVVHGWSMGGLVAAEFAALVPRHLARLVLVNTPLPMPLTRSQQIGWRTVGRTVISLGPPLAHTLVRLWGRTVVETKLSMLRRSTPTTATLRGAGGDTERVAPENLELWTEQLTALHASPERMSYTATAFASVVRGIFVDPAAIEAAFDRIAAPVLLVAGAQDPMVEQAMIDAARTRHPDWDLHVFPSAGHLVPLELPDEYAATVGKWMTGHPPS